MDLSAAAAFLATVSTALIAPADDALDIDAAVLLHGHATTTVDTLPPAHRVMLAFLASVDALHHSAAHPGASSRALLLLSHLVSPSHLRTILSIAISPSDIDSYALLTLPAAHCPLPCPCPCHSQRPTPPLVTSILSLASRAANAAADCRVSLPHDLASDALAQALYAAISAVHADAVEVDAGRVSAGLEAFIHRMVVSSGGEGFVTHIVTRSLTALEPAAAVAQQQLLYVSIRSKLSSGADGLVLHALGLLYCASFVSVDTASTVEAEEEARNATLTASLHTVCGDFHRMPATVQEVFLQRIPMRYSLPRSMALALVRWAGDACVPHLSVWLAAWSSGDYVARTDTSTHVSLSTHIHHAIQYLPPAMCSMMSPIALAVMAGMQQRLDSAIPLVRVAGMRIAEALVARIRREQPDTPELSFEEDTRARTHEHANVHSAFAMTLHMPAIMQLNEHMMAREPPAAMQATGAGSAAAAVAPAPTAQNMPPPAATPDTVFEFSWPLLSIEQWAQTGNAVLPQTSRCALTAASPSLAVVAARKLMSHMPSTLDEVIARIRATTNEYAPVVAALCHAPTLIRNMAVDAHWIPHVIHHTPALLQCLLACENRFAFPDFTVWRFTGIVACVVSTGPLGVRELMKALTRQDESLGTRFEVCDMLLHAAREMAGLQPAVLPQTPWDAVLSHPGAKAGPASAVFPGASSSSAIVAKPSSPPLEQDVFSRLAADVFFFPLLHALTADNVGIRDNMAMMGLTHDEATPLGRRTGVNVFTREGNELLHAHALQTLGKYLALARGSEQVYDMYAALSAYAWPLRDNPHASVRVGVMESVSAMLHVTSAANLWLRPATVAATSDVSAASHRASEDGSVMAQLTSVSLRTTADTDAAVRAQLMRTPHHFGSGSSFAQTSIIPLEPSTADAASSVTVLDDVLLLVAWLADVHSKDADLHMRTRARELLQTSETVAVIIKSA